MLDAAELAQLLISRRPWDRAVEEYERVMFSRVVSSAKGGAQGAATFLSHDGPVLTLAMYQGHHA